LIFLTCHGQTAKQLLVVELMWIRVRQRSRAAAVRAVLAERRARSVVAVRAAQLDASRECEGTGVEDW